MMTWPPSSTEGRSKPNLSDEHAVAQLKRAIDAVDEHNVELALRLLIEVVHLLIERISTKHSAVGTLRK